MHELCVAIFPDYDIARERQILKPTAAWAFEGEWLENGFDCAYLQKWSLKTRITPPQTALPPA